MVDLVFTLPHPPPSLNSMYGRNARGGVYLKAHARKWKRMAAWSLLAQRRSLGLSTITERVKVDIALPTSSRMDVDNGNKLILDALQASGIVENDKLCAPVSIDRAHVAETTITITRAGE